MLHRLLRILAATAILAGAAACGDDDTTSAEDPAAAEETTDEDVGPESDDEPNAAEDEVAAATAGHVLIGDDMFDFVPRQCSFFPGGIITIWGTAASDPEVSITYDVFDEGGQPKLYLEVPPGYSASPWMSESVTAIVDGETVKGNATMVQSGSGDTSLVGFEFKCA